MTTLEKLKEILSECKGEDLEITPETTFDSLEFDSSTRWTSSCRSKRHMNFPRRQYAALHHRRTGRKDRRSGRRQEQLSKGADMQTKLTKLLGIRHPIIQGGMAWIADASLASAVSNAGGLGIISAMNAGADWVREEIHKCRAMTDQPFGVNIMLMSPHVEEVAEMVAEEKRYPSSRRARATPPAL